MHECPNCHAQCDCDPGGPYPQTCRHICDDDLGDERDYEGEQYHEEAERPDSDYY